MTEQFIFPTGLCEKLVCLDPDHVPEHTLNVAYDTHMLY